MQIIRHKKALFIGILFLGLGTVRAQESVLAERYEARFSFRQGAKTFDPSFAENGSRMSGLIDKLRSLQQDTLCEIESVRIVVGTSPEGNTDYNKQLSGERARQIADYLRRHARIGDSLLQVEALGIDWPGLIRAVEGSDVSYKAAALDILSNTPEWILRDGKVVDGRKRRLQMLNSGAVWQNMDTLFFPHIRNARVTVTCRLSVLSPETGAAPAPDIDGYPAGESVGPDDGQPVTASGDVREEERVSEKLQETTVQPDTIPVAEPSAVAEQPFRPFMALRSNLLYDAALVPNIGLEFYLGRGWAVGVNWMYAWWSRDKSHKYWRTYGGEADVRKYFGRRAQERPLTGHHIGLYGQMLTYDVETGGTGYLSELSYGVGVEYGYSLPIGRRLNLDFGVGIGYFGGEYKTYKPMAGHYVWQETAQRHWFGPTKAEISLVWLFDKQKGGRR